MVVCLGHECDWMQDGRSWSLGVLAVASNHSIQSQTTNTPSHHQHGHECDWMLRLEVLVMSVCQSIRHRRDRMRAPTTPSSWSARPSSCRSLPLQRRLPCLGPCPLLMPLLLLYGRNLVTVTRIGSSDRHDWGQPDGYAVVRHVSATHPISTHDIGCLLLIYILLPYILAVRM